MTEAEIAWVAGILEGEACFDTTAGASGVKYPRIRVEMTDTDVVERLRDVTGIGRINYRDMRNERWRNTAYWTVSKKHEAAPLLRLVLPWMGVRRAGKIRQLLA